MSSCFQIRLIQAEGPSETFTARPEQSVLQAALQAGASMLSSCRNGTCRACVRQLLEGEIAYRIEWPGLSREEKAAGWILPCVAEARSDLLLAPVRGKD
ncbi:2Fe-2S iron-sulfur cluster-binding protein [Paucibacter sp. DJ1R-11]|uniref:2Fe-2S iron-sulfur cluster-binding protein n=1 Tax=Paucibacter sp. DJ1R-11 TaxID=2893556 RepID=UPI0021E4B174|nr:2Fe-2S iron-sulfur cluster-binding protein [Paucibacter sp. DJ1R-11]MCV2364302.1 2Fe-2S iron-sulfur cluster-binding protein [Paucibacter sp. DJ1R-11]